MLGREHYHLLLLLLHGFEYIVARAVAVDGAALAAGFPCLHVEAPYEFFGDVRGEVDGHRDAVVHPLLHGALHPHFLEPVHVVARRLIIR